jgi:quercetin 2,3-dioxygenase
LENKVVLKVRKANERGHFKNDWLDSNHTFSFGEYHDPQHMGVSVLRVINDDRVIPGAGFATHPHNNMEIVSYVLEGELAHKDSMGNGNVIRPGDVQRMSAGTGIMHSEFNPSDENGVHFLQIWLLPNKHGVKPGYEQKFFSAEDKQGTFRLLVSPDGRDGSIAANSDALLYAAIVSQSQQLSYDIQASRVIYVHVAQGSIRINGEELGAGDGITIDGEPVVHLLGVNEVEVLLFDLPST